jgi:hypothetical protein
VRVIQKIERDLTEAQPAKMTTITLVLSGALVLSAVPPSIAAPIPSNPVVMKTAAQGSVTNVRSRHHAWHNDGWVAGAIIGGLALGAIPAATTPPYYSAYGYGPYAVTYGYRPYYGYRFYRPYGYDGYRPYGYRYYRYRPYGFGAPYWHRGWSYRWYRYPWR